MVVPSLDGDGCGNHLLIGFQHSGASDSVDKHSNNKETENLEAALEFESDVHVQNVDGGSLSKLSRLRGFKTQAAHPLAVDEQSERGSLSSLTYSFSGLSSSKGKHVISVATQTEL